MEKQTQLPRNLYELEKLCSEYFMDIVHGSNERFPELYIQYKTLDNKYGGATFGQFFFFGECIYLLRNMETPDEDSNPSVFDTVFDEYKSPEYKLAWNDCKRIELSKIFTSREEYEEYEDECGIILIQPKDAFFGNHEMCQEALESNEFDYYVKKVCERSYPLVFKAMDEDMFPTVFCFLKYAQAFSETWSYYYNFLVNSDPLPSSEDIERLKADLSTSYIMPFETEPLSTTEILCDNASAQKMVDRIKSAPDVFGWETFDQYIEQERIHCSNKFSD